MSDARADEYQQAPAAAQSGSRGSRSSRRRSRVVALTAPVVGRTMTLPAGTRLVALYSLDDGRWVVTFNGAQFAVEAVPVEWA